MDAATSEIQTTQSAPLWRGRFFCAILTCATLGGLAATLAGLGARRWWLWELATHFTPYTAVALMLLMVGWAMARRWCWMGLCAVCLAWQVGQLVPLYRVDPQLVVEGDFAGSGLRVMSQNVLTHNRHHRAVLDLVGEVDPDVVVLIETDQTWMWEMAPLDATYPHQLRAPWRGNFGMTLYSQLPLESAEVLLLGTAGLPSLTATVATPQGPLRLLATHTLPPIGRANAALRDDQLAAIAQWVKQSDLPTLVIGDLNITPWSPLFHDLLEGGGLHNTQRGYGVSPTWYARGVVGLPIDHALVTAGVGVLDRRLGPAVGSDHRAVVVDLVVTKGEERRRPQAR